MSRVSDKNGLLLITTGGTIDKCYDVVSERFHFKGGSFIPEVCELSYLSDVRVENLIAIDSLDMRTTHRAQLALYIEECAERRIVITHGTSTILDTAKYLEEQFAKEKTIVLTGALKPWKYDQTEASCNIGTALCAARYFEPGVYVAMHGLVGSHNTLIKDSDTFRFQLKEQVTLKE